MNQGGRPAAGRERSDAMLESLYRRLEEEVSGAMALAHVREIVRHHRIQATPGFRAAASYVASELERVGLKPEVLKFPADGRAQYWCCLIPLEWRVESAELWLVSPPSARQRLCRYQDNPLCLVPRSSPTPPGGVEADLVVLDRADEEASYQGLDLAGKVVLSGADFRRVRQVAIGRHGAMGIITDHMPEIPGARSRFDLPDAVHYASFWPAGGEDPRGFAFALSPRQGLELRALLRRLELEARERGEQPPAFRVKAEIKASFLEGHFEVVTAAIPGRTPEEVLVVSHLCHPQPSANDNASGCAVSLEVARTLNRLYEAGRLPRPRRGIRFLFVPEMTGTFAFLSSREDSIPRWVAGLNLDMVGENHDLCRSAMLAEMPPRALPSFAGVLAARLLKVAVGWVAAHAGENPIPSIRHHVMPFAGGSDHFILSDPTVNVPTPMIIQWPDRFYHSSQDTPDKCDPAMLAKVAALAGTYLQFLADAGYARAAWLAQCMSADFGSEVAVTVIPELEQALDKAQETAAGGDPAGAARALSAALARFDRRLAFFRDRKLADMGSVARLVEPERQGELQALLQSLREEVLSAEMAAQCRARNLVSALKSELGLGDLPEHRPPALSDWEQKAARMVPRRRYRGPIYVEGWLSRLPPEERAAAEDLWFRQRSVLYHGATLAGYWMDGRRTLLEILDLVEMETGRREPELLVRFIEMAANAGLLEVETAGGPAQQR
ncbi:MAG: DUF4910 domain-containing protein [Acetobacteraceae bacterium]|nr:DUF4910 domain-containing protein [Acetobacteraceae bacterium]